MRKRILAAVLSTVLLAPALSACGDRDSASDSPSATDTELHCKHGSVIGRESPDIAQDGAVTPQEAVESALVDGEHAESVPASPEPDTDTVTVIARLDDHATAIFKTWNPKGRGWFIVETMRCTD
jgi:hypothetical protein